VKKAKEHIGLKIKRIRAFKGMKQEDLATAIGRTRSLISHFERTGNINQYTLQEIAEVLDVDLNQLEQPDLILPLKITSDPQKTYRKKQNSVSSETGLELIIENMKSEIHHLRDTIQHQWKLLHELAKNK
jgi:transcriptional regulator with XRE-family HTH domain